MKKLTRSNFLKASLAALSAPLVWLVSRPEVVDLKPITLDFEQIEGSDDWTCVGVDPDRPGLAGQILVYDGCTTTTTTTCASNVGISYPMQWYYPGTNSTA